MWKMQNLFYDLFFLCVCSRVFIHSLICKHNGQWLFSAALLKLTLNFSFELFISERNVKLPLPAEDQEGKQWGKEGLINFSSWSSNCWLEAGGLLSFEAWKCQEKHCGVGLWLPFRGSSTLQHWHGVVEKWNCGQGTLAIQVSSEECRGHPKETSLSGNEVTWLLLKLDLKSL